MEVTVSPPRLVDVLCCCGWTGQLPARGPCPACKCSHHDRVTKDRIAALRAIHARPTATVFPVMATRLVEMGLITRGARRPPNTTTTPHLPGREHYLTEQGSRVLAAADAATTRRAS